MAEFLFLLLAGAVAGALNAAGGGGTFVALPALVATGLSPVTANAAATVALVPGALVSAWVYRREVLPIGTTSTKALLTASVLGGGAGAALLLTLPSESFDAAVPWLLAFATIVLAFGRPLSAKLSALRQRRATAGSGSVPSAAIIGTRTILIGQFILAIYGGYFGGAVGILMLAFWSIGLGLDTATSNPMRIVQLGAVYLTATLLFLVASDVLAEPLPLAAMLVGALAGGYGGAHLVRRLPPGVLRTVVLTTAVVMTVLYFLRG
ncbi:TSUP family transporter [Actinoalloteichus hymeniacidonis]|uniref:TSUP family transporter n=1 Tax=Actinoalloteichus hymeniacidonis TaxID=340345 RepID=UPI000852DE59|nr:TSUP family transporter [Actinoalloteichus hymeniacidonis]MBB5907816.1 hypothetical protein [Actinoalloteichus hymeniacidonis]